MAEPSTSTETWYYAVNGQSLGPLNTAQLQALISTRQIAADTSVWKAGMAGWLAAGQIPELSQACAEATVQTTTATPPPPPRAVSPSTAVLSPARKRRRIGYIVAAGFAVIAICLPWGYVYVGAGDIVSRGGVVIGAYFWQAILCMVLGLGGLAAAILDLTMPNGPRIWPITQWCHIGLYSGLSFFALLGVALPLADSHGFFGGSGSVIPIASVIVLALSIAALVLAILDCREQN